VDFDDARTIGRRVRQTRYARGKSLRVVAELAGISKSHLHRIETGQRALDSRSEIVALANALRVAPTELTTLPIPAAVNGGADAGISAVRLALMAVNECHPGGQIVPVGPCEPGSWPCSTRAAAVTARTRPQLHCRS
jgi:hypothetical protein